MKFGFNLLLWTAKVTEEHLPLIEVLKEMGYDGIQVPLLDLDEDRYAELGAQLDDLGVERTAVGIRGLETNPISPDASIRAASIEYAKRQLDTCRAGGMTELVGPLHSALGEFSGSGPTGDEWKWSVDCLREVAEHAGDLGVMLAVEPLNRFESYLLNTQADAVRFVRDVDHPNCQVLYDTFHANIEEKSVFDAIHGCAEVLGHVHISENDRSTPGEGAVNWEETFDALSEVGYDGWMVVEAFGVSMPEVVAATKIWRRMYESEEQLASDALEFMQESVELRWGA